jgi:hypothetical protein
MVAFLSEFPDSCIEISAEKASNFTVVFSYLPTKNNAVMTIEISPPLEVIWNVQEVRSSIQTSAMKVHMHFESGRIFLTDT